MLWAGVVLGEDGAGEEEDGEEDDEDEPYPVREPESLLVEAGGGFVGEGAHAGWW